MAFLLGLSVDDLEILPAFQEKGPEYRKIHIMLLFCSIRNRNKLQYWLLTSRRVKTLKQDQNHSQLLTLQYEMLYMTKHNSTFFMATAVTIKQCEILHSLRIILLIIRFPHSMHFWCKCYSLCSSSHLERHSVIFSSTLLKFNFTSQYFLINCSYFLFYTLNLLITHKQ